MTKKRILITGASSGFGRLAVQMLLAKGHIVLAGLRGGQDRMQEVFAEEMRQYPDTLQGVDLHMERPETFEILTEWIQKHWQGKLDVLINNAGYGLFGPLEDQQVKQLRHQMEVNFFGPMILTRLLLPFLRNSEGRILNISSIAGRFTFPFYGSYSASKFALEALTEGLRYELMPFKVQVALIEPGGFRTDFSTRSKTVALTEGSVYAARTRALVELFKKSGARLGDPARVARLLVRLSEQKRIPPRSLVGADAWLLTILSRLIPDRWRVGAEEWLFRKFVFKD